MENQTEFPYLRRSQAVGVRKRSLLLRLLGVFVGTLAVPLVGAAGYSISRFALTSPLFTLTSADIVPAEGNQYVSRDEVRAALGFPGEAHLVRGINLLRLSLDEKRKQVEMIPWVRSAYLTRAFPHTLRVQVTERSPVAFVRIEGRVKLIDADGVLLEKPAGAVFDFPVVTGLDTGITASERASRLALCAEFEKQTAADVSRSGWMVSEVDLSDPDDLKAVLVQGQETVQAHFGHSEFSERFRNFLTLWPEVHSAVGRVDSMDLRYQRQIVVNPETPPRAPASRGGAGNGARPETPNDGLAERH